MKHIKSITPKIGDYVVVQYDNVLCYFDQREGYVLSGDKLEIFQKFINSHIGEVRNIGNRYYEIFFENFLKNFQDDYWKYFFPVFMTIDKIVYWSPNREDCEIYLLANKYNI